MIDLPADWRAACATIAASGWRRVLVAGPNGAGKSTFSRHLATTWGAALLDADIGQQSLGPPATVALRRDGAEAPDLYFVGTTSPLAQPLALLAGTARLARLAGAARLVCNTSGLLGGPGLALKTFKIDAVQPDALVILAAGAEAQALAEAHRHLPLLALRPSALARRRSTGQRRAARRAGFAAFLAGARAQELGDVVLQRRPPDAMPGLLCGLADDTGACLGIGLLCGLEPLTVLTPLDAAAVRIVQFGGLRLAADGSEV